MIEEVDPSTNKTLVKAKLISRIPSNVKGFLGDVISNLRSCLDQATCALAEANGASVKNIYFPVATDSADFSSNNIRKKVAGLSADSIKLIDSFEPYGGGKGERFWLLSKLEAINKHQRIVAIGHATQKLIFTNGTIKGPAEGSGDIKFHGGVWDETSQCINLFTKDVGVNINCDIHVAFHMAFGEIDQLKGQPIMPFFKDVVDGIDHFLNSCVEKGLC